MSCLVYDHWSPLYCGDRHNFVCKTMTTTLKLTTFLFLDESHLKGVIRIGFLSMTLKSTITVPSITIQLRYSSSGSVGKSMFKNFLYIVATKSLLAQSFSYSCPSSVLHALDSCRAISYCQCVSYLMHMCILTTITHPCCTLPLGSGSPCTYTS